MKTVAMTDEQFKQWQAILKLSQLRPSGSERVQKWEPKKGSYFVSGGGSVYDSRIVDEEMLNFGKYYPTKEAAEKARDAMRTHNRLLAWLSENDDGWVADWEDGSQAKWFVFYNPRDGIWGSGANSFTKGLGAVYMSRENAEKLCRLLNVGVVEL
jgi:hypothetical protein